MADRLRELWDFSDLDGSEARLRAQLEREPDDAGRAEVLTQLARVEGLRGRFDEAEALVAEAKRQSASSQIVQARVDLERGRILRSSGDPASAFPLFERAFQTALDAGQEWIAADAAHMAAIATGDGDVVEALTQRGIELAESSIEPGVDYWLGPLLNNLGWHEVEAGELERALVCFRRALEARERTGAAEQIEMAREAVAETLRLLERTDEPPLLEPIA